MGLETATYINGLVSTNPTGVDGKSQGDDHIRLIKAVLLATFPNITGAVAASQTSLVKHNFSAGAAPTVNDDTGDGYTEGSIWVNLVSDQAYILVDDTLGAAKWKALTGVASGMYMAFFQSSTTIMTGWTFHSFDVDYVIAPSTSNSAGGTDNGVTPSNTGWDISGLTMAHTHTFSDSGTTSGPSSTVVRDFSSDPYDSASSSHTHTFSVSGTTAQPDSNVVDSTGAWRPPTLYCTIWSKD